MKKQQLFVLFLSLFFFNCQNNKKLKETDFLISYPPYFKYENSGQHGTVFILATEQEGDDDNFIENINLSKKNANNKTLGQYSEKIMNEIPNFGDILEYKKIRINNKNCFRIIFKTKKDNIKLTVLQHFYIKNNEIYALTFISDSTKFENYLVDINQIFMTFKLLDNVTMQSPR